MNARSRDLPPPAREDADVTYLAYTDLLTLPRRQDVDPNLDAVTRQSSVLESLTDRAVGE